MYEFHLLSPERWADFEKLFGTHGAFGGCWCMWWLIPHSQFNRNKGEGNRLAFKALVETGSKPGILAYDGCEPVGWCAFGPREGYLALENSRSLKRVDDTPVWSVVCFYIARRHRHQGLTVALLRSVIEEARRQGGKVIEGYPTLPNPNGEVDALIYMGLVSSFLQAGFSEVAQRGEKRVIMRYVINEQSR